MDEKLKKIRMKKIGALLLDARQHFGLSAEQSAGYMGVDEENYLAFERGEMAPSLPQIELFAYQLQVPPEHFWGDEVLQDENRPPADLDIGRLLVLRRKLIGAQLRHLRVNSGRTLDDVAQNAGLSSERLEQYELGKEVVDLPTLEALSKTFSQPIKEFQDQHGPVGAWLNEKNSVDGVEHLTPELQAFIAKPVNQPYLELALRLSEMSVDKLRSVAEGLLEITL